MGLPWFRMDTNLPSHDKIIELVGVKGGKAAAFVYVASLAYAVGNGTDGLIRRAALPFVHGTTTDARILAEARLWDVVEGGWRIRNFGTRQMIAAESQAAADAISASRKRAANKRWGND